jgi:EAL domain-containing protein (putative c-di-GMP-specific phosphodiesterase class I)
MLLISFVLVAESAFVVALLVRMGKMRKSAAANNVPDMENKVNTSISQEENKTTESILNGIENNEFKMYLQFVVDNKTKEIVSAEALSRWECPEKGIIGPGYYIGNMEHAGIISKHDFYMFELACSQLEKWSGTEYKDISISCNFTRITLSEADCIENLKRISEKYNFDRAKLAIEMTADAIEKNTEIAKRKVMICKDLGFKVYLDDLGNGYTSLSNLCDYPIDVVKIDRDILLKTDTPKGKALFCGIVALAHRMDIAAIGEGVETEEQNTLVSESDCDYIQGWYYTKALPLEECEAFIENYNTL